MSDVSPPLATFASSHSDDRERPVVIVGAGLAGLACATDLVRHGTPVRVLESGDGPGGRVRTDWVDGFPCDRGFQVFLPAYPTARRLLDYDALDLRPLPIGARIYDGERLHTFGDPLQDLSLLPATLTSRVVSLPDKLRMARLRFEARRQFDQLATLPDHSTAEELQRRGFSRRAIEHFFRPFFGGVLLDRTLATTQRMLHFTYAMFSRGGAAWPARGMQAIPDQLAAQLPAETIEFGATVVQAASESVRLADGRTIEARDVIVATDQRAASVLIESVATPSDLPATTTVYFTTPTPPTSEAFLHLNGSGRGRVNTVLVLSAAVPELVTGGRHLISVALKEAQPVDESLIEQLRAELAQWLPGTEAWEVLHDVTVIAALPDQSAGTARPPGVARIDGVLVAGDWRSFGSIEHAVQTGREAARQCLEQIAAGGPVSD